VLRGERDRREVARDGEHPERATKREPSYDVEREEVKPWEAVEPDAPFSPCPAVRVRAVLAARASGAEPVPLARKLADVELDMRLESAHARGREDVRDELALARVLRAVARVEESAMDRDERAGRSDEAGAGVFDTQRTYS
jgi:hypothetical protein